MNKKRFSLIGVIILTLTLLFSFIVYDNYNIGITSYTVKSNVLPENFDGFKIIQISDLHNEDFGDENKTLLTKIKEQNPDIIVITGDSIDSRKTNVRITLDFFENLVKIAPAYFVIGNHEVRSSSQDYTALLEGTENIGIKVLRTESVYIDKSNEKIQIIGLDDVTYFSDSPDEYKTIVKEKIEKTIDKNTFTILLSHHPEIFDVYKSTDVDLVFSGHAHGGQIRLPFNLGGVIAPEQWFFPKYSEGVFSENGTTMIISRGLGNSIIPLRINNPPEIIAVTLNYEKQ